VDDLDAAVAGPVNQGAMPTDFQPQQNAHVMLDPEGHPLCLFL
jgi:hypothetical protein